MKYKVYTDGACSGNPGPGGYAFVLLTPNESPLVVSGRKNKTTNNRMEMFAIIRAIEYISKLKKRKESHTIEIYSDSAYCINSIVAGSVLFWESNNWVSVRNKEVKNRDLWERFLAVVSECKNIKFEYIKVKGHSDDIYNSMADQAARGAIRK